jgi:pimeloyl-ACP methyl ester carboxylesterase
MTSPRPLALSPAWTTRTITIDGLRTPCVDMGRGEPVVFLHGYPESRLAWRHQLEALSRTHRVCAADWPGWGDSERSLAITPDYDSEVERIGHLLDALEIEAANLVVHDYGGFLGLGFVARRPERVRRLAILNSRAQRTFPGVRWLLFAALGVTARSAVLGPVLERSPLAAIHFALLDRYLRRGCFDRAEVERYVGWMRTAEGKRWFRHFFVHYPLAVRGELLPSLARISCPTTVIWGDEDPYNPFAIAEELAREIPGATLVRLRGADHFVMEERPEEVNEALREWLHRPSPRSAG